MSSSPPPGPPLPPGAPPPIAAAPPMRPVPWEERAALGFGPAVAATAELFAMRPREGFLRACRRGDVLSPILWVALVALAGALAQALWGALIGLPLQGLIDGADTRLVRIALSAGGGVFNVVFGPISAVAGVFVVAGILHGGLALLGALDRSPLGYEGSLRAVAYAYTAQLALVVPLVGGLIAFFWTLVLAAIGLEVLHDTTFGRALAAVLIPLLACCLCGLLVGVLFGAALAGLAGRLS